jgi:hypothetical protein
MYTAEVDIWTDPYSGLSPTTEDERLQFVQSRMIDMIGVLLISILHNYIV